jgi:PIN domain nuclease of toxin-antitoxin system
VESRVLVSAISVWEVGMLEAKGRIRLGKDREAWVPEALSLPGVRLVPVDDRVALSSTRLPGDFHGDPADRLLVATARALDATLATRDTAILAYGREGYVRTLEA